MPHATSSPPSDTESPPPDHTASHLTESILTLLQTIHNIRQDVAAGIAPSILLPPDTTDDLANGMLQLNLDPSTPEINAHLGPLETRLNNLKHSLISQEKWIPPPSPPKAPEYSIIDVADLDAAVRLLERLTAHSLPVRTQKSARKVLQKFKWVWDAEWKEFYADESPNSTSSTSTSTPSSTVYLSRWRVDPQSLVWEHIRLVDAELGPESAALALGSWDEWEWDEAWKEWYLDCGEGTRVCANRWEVRGGVWVYVGGLV